MWDAGTGLRIPEAAIPETVLRKSTSPNNNFFLLPRFKKVLFIPLKISPQEQKARKSRTRPRPDLHKMAGEQLTSEGHQFAAQVQLALEQQALGQESANDGKPEEAKSFFAKAKELWPKLVPVKITQQAMP